jgi:hypothetical protein
MTTGTAPLISVNEARRLLGGRGRGRIYELLASGDLESVVDGKRRFIVTESLTRYIARLRAETRHAESR